jgi:hypothetical protein
VPDPLRERVARDEQGYTQDRERKDAHLDLLVPAMFLLAAELTAA